MYVWGLLQERRETYRAEMRRKEEEEARRHKEKQRLKVSIYCELCPGSP